MHATEGIVELVSDLPCFFKEVPIKVKVCDSKSFDKVRWESGFAIKMSGLAKIFAKV